MHLPNFPSELGLPDYHEASYDPLWGALEPSLHWIPGFLSQLDRKVAGPHNLPNLRLKPSEYFHRNVVARQFAETPEAERELICSANAARIYHL